MSESKKESSLLGKKRESEKREELKEEVKKKSKKKEKKNEEEEEDDSSSSSSESQPRQSLFGKNEKGFKGGLFGDLDNPQQPTSLFDKPKEGTSLFGNTSGNLFGNTGGSLFGNISSDKKPSSGLFSGGLFDFSQVNKKKEDEGEGEGEAENEGDDNIGKSNSPKHEYNPENENKEDKDGYIKRYIKKVDKVLLYDGLQKTFVSKGDGFLIIETQETENEEKKKERFARILFRNTIGGIIFQGILHKDLYKCICSEKKLKHICLIIFLMKNGDEKSDLTLGQARIIFNTLDEINNFSKKYNDTIKYINNEIDEF